MSATHTGVPGIEVNMEIPGLGAVPAALAGDLLDLPEGGEGRWKAGQHGVTRILTPLDRKVEFIVFGDSTLVYVKSAMGYPAIYPLFEATFTGPAEAVLMDLDGTTVTSETFWVWIIGRTVARLLDNPRFELEDEDAPHVSGHSVSEHLQYCIAKYCPDKTVEEAREHYFSITRHELAEIEAGRGHQEAFIPTPGLRDFLLAVKSRGIQIALVSSGLHEKAWPSIVSVFATLKLGDPLDFYDAIITAGTTIRKGQAGTLGELSPKPHPWLYAEAARVGLGIDLAQRARVIGIEDSGAGIVSVRLAGFAALGIDTGNIAASGARPLLWGSCHDLHQAISLVCEG